jgi:hypothetical protein
MSSTRSIEELVTFFDGTSPSASTLRWIPASLPSENTRPSFTLQWTTPTMRHDLSVLGEQGTVARPGEVRSLFLRAVCHMFVDSLSVPACLQLIPILFDMRDYDPSKLSFAPSQLVAGPKRARMLATVVRPEVEIPEE